MGPLVFHGSPRDQPEDFSHRRRHCSLLPEWICGRVSLKPASSGGEVLRRLSLGAYTLGDDAPALDAGLRIHERLDPGEGASLRTE